MHILVTRPEPGATELRLRLEGAGHRVTLAPMLSIVVNREALPDLEGVAGLIATSRNGLRALEGLRQLPVAQTLPVFVVGPGTARLARDLGFSTIIEGAGTGSGLVPVIGEWVAPGAGPLVHLAGDEVAFDLKGALAAKGYEVQQVAVYSSIPCDRLAPEVVAEIARGAVDLVVVMSPRTAEVLVERLLDAGLGDAAHRLTYVCLSEAVARRLIPLIPARIEVADAPHLEALLSRIVQLTATRS